MNRIHVREVKRDSKTPKSSRGRIATHATQNVPNNPKRAEMGVSFKPWSERPTQTSDASNFKSILGYLCKLSLQIYDRGSCATDGWPTGVLPAVAEASGRLMTACSEPSESETAPRFHVHQPTIARAAASLIAFCPEIQGPWHMLPRKENRIASISNPTHRSAILCPRDDSV